MKRKPTKDAIGAAQPRRVAVAATAVGSPHRLAHTHRLLQRDPRPIEQVRDVADVGRAVGLRTEVRDCRRDRIGRRAEGVRQLRDVDLGVAAECAAGAVCGLGQLVQRGGWYLDVGYHIASALTVEDRRHAERDLVRHYLDRLAAGGVDAPPWDDAWLGLRRGILHGFYLWGITLKVDPAITTVLLERPGTAAADHAVFDAVSS